MKTPIKILFIGLGLVITTLACKKEELDFDKFSKMVKIQRSIAMPLTHGEIHLKELIGNSTDSILTIEGDSSFTDSLGLSLTDLKSLHLDTFNLYYVSRNYLPVGINLRLITYDSSTHSALDTINFADTGFFLQPAPLDNNGNVIESEVVPVEGAIKVSSRAADNLLHHASHLILNAELYSDTTRIIPFTDQNYIWLDLGIYAKGYITTNLNNILGK
jgi:hypothetical protein